MWETRSRGNEAWLPGPRGKGPGGQESRELPTPGALTVVLLLQPAQDPEDPSFRDFQGVCLLGVAGKLLPGPQPAYGRLHLSGLTGAFLQLLLVIAGEAASTQLSLSAFNSPSAPLSLSEPLFCLASSGTGTQAQVLGDWVLVPALPLTSHDCGHVTALLWAPVAPKGKWFSLPCHCKSLDFSGLQVSPGKTDLFSCSGIK